MSICNEPSNSLFRLSGDVAHTLHKCPSLQQRPRSVHCQQQQHYMQLLEEKNPNLARSKTALRYWVLNSFAETTIPNPSTSSNNNRNSMAPMTTERRSELNLRIANIINKNRDENKPIPWTGEKEEWRKLPDYGAAIELNRAFVSGERKKSIYHYGPLCPESKNLIPALIELHDYGFLTCGSQPFEPSSPRVVGGDLATTGYWYSRRQRPYLSFLVPQNERMERQVVHEFCKLLLANPKVITVIVEEGKPTRGNIEQVHWVTERRVALSTQELYAEPFVPFTSVWMYDDHQANTWGVKAIGEAETLEISIASMSWEEDVDLLALVKEEAEAAGMTKLYAQQHQSGT